MNEFPIEISSFILQGPVGDLELSTTPRQTGIPHRNATVVICHPHPLYGGTMDNKVVTTLMRAFSELGLQTVRFNFRGVGKSAGSFAEGIGELDDLKAVMDWVKQVCPHDDIWLAGFSFGAAVSATMAAKIPVAQLVSIAPPVPRFRLPQLASVTCPWLIVQGEKDEIVIPADVFAWVETRDPKPELIKMPLAGHFFHGQLMALREILVKALA